MFGRSERIVAPLGLRVRFVTLGGRATARWFAGACDRSAPSLCGPVLNVRKFTSIPMRPEGIVANGTISPPMLAFLAACVRGRANIIVSGGTSSGKTTLLGVLSRSFPTGNGSSRSRMRPSSGWPSRM